MANKRSYVEAFKESFNTIGLATAVALSAATLNPLPLLAGLVLEAAYLLFVPDSKWYQARLSERYDKEVEERRTKLKEQVFPLLSASTQARFDRLEFVRHQVDGYEVQGKKFFREVLRKMDYLLEKFLMFASKQVQFQDYLRSVLADVSPESILPPPLFDDRDDRRGSKKRRIIPQIEPCDDQWIMDTVKTIQGSYRSEIESIDQLVTKDGNLHNQAVLEKRKEVLHRRSQYVARIGEILINVDHQLHLMEDTFGLINDEIRARSPEQVLADIEDVVFQTDSLTETLQDVAPFEQMEIPAGSAKLYDIPDK